MAIKFSLQIYRGGYQGLGTSSLPINIPAMTDQKDVDAAFSILDGIGDAIITLPEAIAFLGRKFFTTWQPGIFFESFCAFENALHVILWQRFQFLNCRAL
jgi:hypothetical protein